MARAFNALAVLLFLAGQAAAAQTDGVERDAIDPIVPQHDFSLKPDAESADVSQAAEPSLLTDDSARDQLELIAPPSGVALDLNGPRDGAQQAGPDQPSQLHESAPLALDPVTTPSDTALGPDSPSADLDQSSTNASFATRHARYVPMSWEDIPGWREGTTLDAWKAFAQGCGVLSRRLAWRQACERAAAERPASPAAARAFFEREFEAFQIRTVDFSDTGMLTGYYEPWLQGSRVRTSRFQHPIYGVPSDLLFLDAALLLARRPPVYVRIEGRDVVRADVDASSAQPDGDARLYRLAVARAPANLRDGKIRVRRSGDQIVPYFTRQEIESRGLAFAEPIAWVDDPEQLYALHIEGSGRIRLPTGEILRVGFGEQNGHPFRPAVFVEAGMRSKGQRVIDFFISPASASERKDNTTSRVVVSSGGDPSYIFFRQISNTTSGPPGAMGVPLTPGASLAVDPRVTPLGAPVFISTRPSGAAVATTRLMVAQDTGGAIRGALRADYFLGADPAAGTLAMRMKDELRMWVLLPKSLAIASKHAGLPGVPRASGSAQADCLLPDPEFCVE